MHVSVVPSDIITIQSAIDWAVPGTMIFLGTDTFAENVAVNKFVKLIGADSGDAACTPAGDPATTTIIRPTSGQALAISASGLSNADPLLLQDFRIELPAAGTRGIELGTLDHLKVDGVRVVGNDPVNTSNQVGMRGGTAVSITDLTVVDSSFKCLGQGWFIAAASSGTSVLDAVTISNSEFSENAFKGIYVEKLSNALIENSTFQSNAQYNNLAESLGIANAAGLDINLKYAAYSNITLRGNTFEGEGLGAQEGAALMVKARDDGSTYGAKPASLDNVLIEENTFNGNERGIRFGEPGKTNAGPTNVVVQNNNITDNVQTYGGSPAGSTYGGLINFSQALVDATLNWWNDAGGPSGDGPGSGDAVVEAVGPVAYCPWLDAAYPGGSPTTASGGYATTSTDSHSTKYCTIEEAMFASVGADQEVHVEEGNWPQETMDRDYSDSPNLVVKSVGDKALTVLNGVLLDGSTFDGLTFDGLTFTGTHSGSFGNYHLAIRADGNYKNLAVINSVFDGQDAVNMGAISFNRGFDGFTLDNNVFQNYANSVARPGIINYSLVFVEAQDTTGGDEFGSNYTVTNNTFNGVNHLNSIEAYRWQNVNISDNTITGLHGRILVWSDDSQVLGPVLIENNDLTLQAGTADFATTGIGIYNASTTATVVGNSVVGPTTGINIGGANAVTLKGNTVTGNGSVGTGVIVGGGSVATVGVDATDGENTISGFATGIQVADGGVSTITVNDIENNDTGVLFEAGATSTLFQHNNITGNATAGAENKSANLIDATLNWWGDASGPSGAGPGSGDAIAETNSAFAICPWLIAPYVVGGTVPTVPTATTSADGHSTKYCTIEEAMFASDADGQEVHVSEGDWSQETMDRDYSDSPNLVVKSVGDKALTVLNGVLLDGSTFDGLTFDGLTFTGTHSGSFGNYHLAIRADGNYKDLAVINSVFDGQDAVNMGAISFNRGFDGFTLDNNVFQNYANSVARPGIINYSLVFVEAQDTTGGDEFGSNYTVTNNTFNGVNHLNSIEAYRWQNVNISDNTITGLHGRILVWSDNSQVLGPVLIENNDLTLQAGTADFATTGIGIYNASTTATVVGNSVVGPTTGINIGGANAVTLKGNTVTGNGSVGTGVIVGGGSVATVGVDATDGENTISGFATGIQVADGGVSTITVNDIENNDIGVLFEAGATSTLFQHNNVSGNTTAGAKNESANFIDATLNWWGDASGPSDAGPGSGDAILQAPGELAVCPWLGAPYVVGGTAVTGNKVKNLDTSEEFCTIQSAIDDGNTDDGDVLDVSAGTFVEQVVTTKAVTIQGQGEGVTIIKSPATLTATFVRNAKTYKPIVLVQTVDDVILKDLTVDGAGLGNANNSFTGVAYYNAGGQIMNVTVVDVRDTPISGAQHGTGILGHVDNASAHTLIVDNADVSGFQKSGVLFSGTGLTVDLKNSTVTGAGSIAFTAQNGVQISGGALGSVTGNTVSGFSYTPATYASTGLLVYPTGGTITVSGNTVENSQVGIWYVSGGGLIDNNTVTYDAVAMDTTPFWWGIIADPGDGEWNAPQPPPSPADFDTTSGGIALRSAAATAAYATTVSNNTLDGAGNGEGIEGYVFGGETLNLTIDTNTVENFLTAIALFEAAGSEMVATVNGNTLTNSGNVGTGIEVDAGVVANIGTLTLGDNNDISGFATGIQIAGTATVLGNLGTITGNTVGINVAGSGTSDIKANDIKDNETGVNFESGATSTQFFCNNVTGNTTTGVNYASAGTLDAEANYWGGVPSTTGSVDADPYAATERDGTNCDSPLSVTIGYFHAVRDGDTVRFDWQTATEAGTSGFNLFAESDGGRTQLNAELVPSKVIDSVTPTSYSFSVARRYSLLPG